MPKAQFCGHILRTPQNTIGGFANIFLISGRCEYGCCAPWPHVFARRALQRKTIHRAPSKAPSRAPTKVPAWASPSPTQKATLRVPCMWEVLQ